MMFFALRPKNHCSRIIWKKTNLVTLFDRAWSDTNPQVRRIEICNSQRQPIIPLHPPKSKHASLFQVRQEFSPQYGPEIVIEFLLILYRKIRIAVFRFRIRYMTYSGMAVCVPHEFPDMI